VNNFIEQFQAGDALWVVWPARFRNAAAEGSYDLFAPREVQNPAHYGKKFSPNRRSAAALA
jgi:hypothetical protein